MGTFRDMSVLLCMSNFYITRKFVNVTEHAAFYGERHMYDSVYESCTHTFVNAYIYTNESYTSRKLSWPAALGSVEIQFTTQMPRYFKIFFCQNPNTTHVFVFILNNKIKMSQ